MKNGHFPRQQSSRALGLIVNMISRLLLTNSLLSLLITMVQFAMYLLAFGAMSAYAGHRMENHAKRVSDQTLLVIVDPARSNTPSEFVALGASQHRMRHAVDASRLPIHGALEGLH
jgi:hypothetical protein